MFFDFYEGFFRSLIYFKSGGIELNNLDMNVEVIQDYLSQVAPFIQIEKATVKQLRVTVCSFYSFYELIFDSILYYSRFIWNESNLNL